jgi:hypothetical protein
MFGCRWLLLCLPGIVYVQDVYAQDPFEIQSSSMSRFHWERTPMRRLSTTCGRLGAISLRVSSTTATWGRLEISSREASRFTCYFQAPIGRSVSV